MSTLTENNAFVLQQDGATTHTAKMVQAWCQRSFITFCQRKCGPLLHLTLIPCTLGCGSYWSRELGQKKKLTESFDQVESETVRATCAQVSQQFRHVIREDDGFIEKSVIYFEDYTLFFHFPKIHCICHFCFRMNRIFNSIHLGGRPCKFHAHTMIYRSLNKFRTTKIIKNLIR